MRTGDASRVRLEADDFGEVEIESNSDLRIAESRTGHQSMSLQQGRLHAFIWAPPQQFVVDTPSARTIPFRQDSTATFKESLAEFESGANPAALTTVLAQARTADALSLWHLIPRVSGPDRRRVFERFASLVRLPADVDAERVIGGDRHMPDLCWNALELHDADWWREWKREGKL